VRERIVGAGMRDEDKHIFFDAGETTMQANKTNERYLSVEIPDTKAVVDFMGEYPVTVKISLVDGELHVYAVSATENAPILIDVVVEVPEGDNEDDDSDENDEDE
jgi:hypothetical protein